MAPSSGSQIVPPTLHDARPQDLEVLGEALVSHLVEALVRRAIIEELRVRLHDQLQHVVRQSAHTRIPVRFAPRARIAVDCTDDEREEVLPVIVDEPDDLVVVPDEQRAFRDLEVRALHTLRDAREELHLFLTRHVKSCK